MNQPAVRSTYTLESFPSDLQKKVTLLKHFRTCMASDILAHRDGTTGGESSLPSERRASTAQGQVYVRKWARRGSAIMFQFSNKDIQVIFFDKTELVLSSRAHMVTYTSKDGLTQSMALAQAMDSPGQELARRLRYVLANLLGVPASELPAALRV